MICEASTLEGQDQEVKCRIQAVVLPLRLCLSLAVLSPCLLLGQTNSAPNPRILSFAVESGAANLSVNSLTSCVYKVQIADSIQGYWSDVSAKPGNGGTLTLSGPASAYATFYRLAAIPRATLTLLPSAPALDTGAVSLPDAIAGNPYKTEISAAQTGAGPYHLQISNSPPAAMFATVISNDTINAFARLSSDGVNLVVGQRSQVSVSVTDGAGTNLSRSYDVRVIGPGPAILTSQLTLKAGQAVNIALAATNGSAPLSWSLPFGALPHGISLSPGGSLQGTPSADAAELGETGLYTNMVQVADSFIDRVTGVLKPRLSTATIFTLVRLSYQYNLIPYRPNGPALGGVCVGCHGPAFPPDFSSGSAVSLIYVSAGTGGQCDGSYTYVIPSDPYNSLLYQKLSGPQCGQRMPQGGPYLYDAQINRVFRWISELTNGDTD